jgi:hypothetical protein
MRPSVTSPPTLSGSPSKDSTLTVSPETWDGQTDSVATQWMRCDSGGAKCAAIPGATGPAYTLADADLGMAIRVRVTAAYAASSAAADTEATGGAIKVVGLKLRKGGTSASAMVSVGKAGSISVGKSTRFAKGSVTVKKAGTAAIVLKINARAKAQLERRGRFSVTLTFRYTPTGGKAQIVKAKLTLRRKTTTGKR